MILYLTEQGLKVNKESQRFKLFYPNSKKSTEIRINDIEEIYIFGKISLSPSVIQTCLKRNIPVHFLSFSGNYLGKLGNFIGKNVELRLFQFQTYFNPEKRNPLAKSFVKGKLINQKIFLTKLKQRYQIAQLEGSIFRLNMFLNQLKQVKYIEEIMGLEGAGSKYYFEGLGLVFKKLGWDFPGRVKRPPTDPINALLSLGYTLLFSKLWIFVESASLDPYLGFLHSVDYGKPSLVLDLMEEWRPVIVDSVVIRCLAWKNLNPQDFTDVSLSDEEKYSIKLTTTGLKKFLKQFQQRLNEEVFYNKLNKKYKYFNLFKEQVYHLARVLKGEEKVYNSFIMPK